MLDGGKIGAVSGPVQGDDVVRCKEWRQRETNVGTTRNEIDLSQLVPYSFGVDGTIVGAFGVSSSFSGSKVTLHVGACYP